MCQRSVQSKPTNGLYTRLGKYNSISHCDLVFCVFATFLDYLVQVLDRPDKSDPMLSGPTRQKLFGHSTRRHIWQKPKTAYCQNN